ncbi:histone deacetylase 15 [Actinidia rufa]|uniref:histone deacetylase n=1 Tax=Actinidia rufa TaxID=165716 RepID=A0A7J0DR78_9ERIC|nr:histone deacetylase 15 [Actinidia rufa]
MTGLHKGMTLTGNCHISSEFTMVSETVPVSRSTNGEAEYNLHNQRDQSLCEGYNGRNGNLCSVGPSIATCQGGNYREERVTRLSVRDTAENIIENMQPDVISKKARHQKETTLQDMYNSQYNFDDDDDDSDWEPLKKPPAAVKWFCVNCTMVNLDDVVRCDICGEHKESGIVKHGFFASPFLKEAGLPQNESEVIERFKDSCLQILESDNSTAVGFDERMLLHSEHKYSSPLMDVEEELLLAVGIGNLDRAYSRWGGETVKSKKLCSAFLVIMEEFRKQHPDIKSVAAIGKAGGEMENVRSRESSFCAVGALLEHSVVGIGICLDLTDHWIPVLPKLNSSVEMKSHPHPERPNRLRAIAASLATAGIFPGRCVPISAREITQDELQMVHSLEHIESVDLTSHVLASYFTPDTYANEHSALAARLAAGLCADLASAILSGRAKNGFALVRPPGHHAGIRHAMGFCLHNNAAVAALAAQVAGAKKVLIVDWMAYVVDLLHEEIYEHHLCCRDIGDPLTSFDIVGVEVKEIPQVVEPREKHRLSRISYPWFDHLYIRGFSLANRHQALTQCRLTIPLLVGTMGAEGYCVNIPWSRGGVGDNDYLFAFQHVVLPIASEFAPDFTIISAGFDAARGDPLGCCDVRTFLINQCFMSFS